MGGGGVGGVAGGSVEGLASTSGVGDNRGRGTAAILSGFKGRRMRLVVFVVVVVDHGRRGGSSRGTSRFVGSRGL